MAKARSRRAPADTAANRPASIVLLAQGLIGFLVGSIFLQRAGQAPLPELAGAAGLLGLLFLVPGAGGIAAGIGLWRERRWGRRAGLIMGWLGVGVAALIALAGTVSANPAALLLALLVGGVDFLIVRSLRNAV